MILLWRKYSICSQIVPTHPEFISIQLNGINFLALCKVLIISLVWFKLHRFAIQTDCFRFSYFKCGADATGGKRSLYIKITTTTNGDAGEALQTSHTFRLDQRAAIYLGRLGGEKDGDGNYTMGLVYTRMSLRTTSSLLADVKPGTTRTGYANIKTAELSYATDNMDNGKTATRHLAENTYNQNWVDAYVPIPQKDASEHVLLYQYQYPASTFSARACYDRNRDENGNGIIDEKEFKWYLPASNQLLGLCVAALPGLGGGGSTTEYISLPPYNYYYFISASDGKFGNSDRTTGSDRCVRNVSLPSYVPY